MTYFQVIKLGIYLEEFVEQLTQIFVGFMEGGEFGFKSFWKVLHWMVAVRRTMDWLVYYPCKSR